MSKLYLVRHGQASFFSSNYDQLSDLGGEQSKRLARYWIDNRFEIDEAYSGTLARQRQTADHVGTGFRDAGKSWPEVQAMSGLNEYVADEFMQILCAELSSKHASVQRLSDDYEQSTDDHERYRTFHRLLEAVMRYYIAGDYESTGFEAWRQFHDRVTDAFSRIRARQGRGRRVAVFTSGGPIGVCVQTTLDAPEQQAGALNWRVYNASVTTFEFSTHRISLDQFNAIPHLATKDLRTYR